MRQGQAAVTMPPESLHDLAKSASMVTEAMFMNEFVSLATLGWVGVASSAMRHAAHMAARGARCFSL